MKGLPSSHCSPEFIFSYGSPQLIIIFVDTLSLEVNRNLSSGFLDSYYGLYNSIDRLLQQCCNAGATVLTDDPLTCFTKQALAVLYQHHFLRRNSTKI